MGSLTDAGVAAPLVLDDAVYVAGGRVLAKLDAATGDVVEKVDLPYAVGGSTGVSVVGASESAGASEAPAPGDRTLIVALQDGGLAAYDEDLEELWQTDPLEAPDTSEGTGLVGEWYATPCRRVVRHAGACARGLRVPGSNVLWLCCRVARALR